MEMQNIKFIQLKLIKSLMLQILRDWQNNLLSTEWPGKSFMIKNLKSYTIALINET